MALDMKSPPQQEEAKPARKSGFNLRLSGPAACLVSAGILLMLGWGFYMGFLIGRGQNPEEHLQKIAAVWQDKGQQETGAPPAETPQPAQPEKAAQAQPAQDQQPQGQQPQAQAGQPPAQVPGYPAFAAEKGPQPAAQAQPAQARPAPPQAQQKTGPVYTFSYRMATVPTQELARQEQARYQGKGVRTVIRAYGKSWQLVCTFKGTDQDCEQFLQTVKKARLGTPVRLGRKKN